MRVSAAGLRGFVLGFRDGRKTHVVGTLEPMESLSSCTRPLYRKETKPLTIHDTILWEVHERTS